MARTFLALCYLAAAIHGVAEDAAVIATMDELRWNAPKEKGRAELVNGKIGNAVRFTFEKESKSAFFTSNIRGTPEWDRSAGFSFWVRGDGSNSLGGLQFIYNDDYALRYDYAFPIRGSEWTKITVPWSDLIPVLPGPNAKPLDPVGGNRPSKLAGPWFGKWWYWSDYPAQSFAVDEIRLEPTIAVDTSNYVPPAAPLERIRAKLKDGKPVTIVTMGDSLTDFRHWANRQVAWPNLLRDRVHEKYKSTVSIVNPAIGGTLLRQNLVLIPRWLEENPQPDLVTVWFGGNDWESGMRGEQFHEAFLDAINRIRRATKGHADVLILTTVPSVKEWKTRAELGEAGRQSARELNAGLADTEKAFWTAAPDDHARPFAWDGVHLSEAGHNLVVEAILQAIASNGGVR